MRCVGFIGPHVGSESIPHQTRRRALALISAKLGSLDLMVPGYNTASGGVLYRNNGDATFTSIDVGSPDKGIGVAGAAYDNDALLDLFITSESADPNFLYHNHGNGNQWLKVKLVGIASNRSAIGAKVRIEATIHGETIRQMRELTGDGGQNGGSGGLVAHFGLGNAATVGTLRIEWLSGIVQEFEDVAVNQQLEVVETQGAPLLEPITFAAFGRDAQGVFQAAVNCPAGGVLCVMESSSDFERWSKVQVRTNVTGTIEFTDAHAVDSPTRFYRVVVP